MSVLPKLVIHTNWAVGGQEQEGMRWTGVGEGESGSNGASWILSPPFRGWLHFPLLGLTPAQIQGGPLVSERFMEK